MSIQNTSELNQSKLNNSKGFTKDNSLIQKSHLTDESLMTTDYFSNHGMHKSKHTNSSLSKHVTENRTTTYSSLENKTETTIKDQRESGEPTKQKEATAQSQLESLITQMREKVTTKMKDDYFNQKSIFKSRKKQLSEFESSLNISKTSLEESIHTVYSLYQENTKKYHEKIRLNKENGHNDTEYKQMKILNEKMQKDIVNFDKQTRKMKMDAFCFQNEVKLASKRCKEMSQLIYNQIEDNKSLKTALLLTESKVDKIKEMMYRYNKKENNIVDQIKIIIKNYC